MRCAHARRLVGRRVERRVIGPATGADQDVGHRRRACWCGARRYGERRRATRCRCACNGQIGRGVTPRRERSLNSEAIWRMLKPRPMRAAMPSTGSSRSSSTPAHLSPSGDRMVPAAPHLPYMVRHGAASKRQTCPCSHSKPVAAFDCRRTRPGHAHNRACAQRGNCSHAMLRSRPAAMSTARYSLRRSCSSLRSRSTSRSRPCT